VLGEEAHGSLRVEAGGVVDEEGGAAVPAERAVAERAVAERP
jgi:hypothetical protein